MSSKWPDSTIGSIAFLIFLILPIVTILTYTNHASGRQVVSVPKAQAQEPSSFPVAVETPARTATPAGSYESGDLTSQQQEIVSYIKEVFGKDSDKALQVLSC